MLSYGILTASARRLRRWLFFRRGSAVSTAVRPAAAAETGRSGPAAGTPMPPPDAGHLGAASASIAERLWKYSYGSPLRTKSTQRMDELVRHNVIAILEVDTLNHDYFPRRPTLRLPPGS